MNNTILIQQVYPDRGFEPMLEMTRAHHVEYCQAHEFDYRAVAAASPEYPMESGAWEKVKLILDAMNEGYANIIWLDADTFIRNRKTDLRTAITTDRIGACWHRIPQLHHWNVGALYIDNSPPTRLFIETWLASYPPPPDGWFEQGVFNRLAMQSTTVVTLSDKWNATIDVNMVPDAVVLGFHGQGDAKRRLRIMREAFEGLFKAEVVHAV